MAGLSTIIYSHPDFRKNFFAFSYSQEFNSHRKKHPMIPLNEVCLATSLFNARISLAVSQFSDGLIQKFFVTCQSKCEWESFGALACVNKHFNECATEFWKQFDLEFLCPGLTILDAQAQGVIIDDEPQTKKMTLLKCFRDLAPHVENNEGMTLLTMVKGRTLNQLVAIAAENGMTVKVPKQALKELGDVPVKQTYVILITNNAFKQSQNKMYSSKKMLVEKHGCRMPKVLEYVALCVFTNKCFRKCLYRQNSWLYGGSCSSTRIKHYPLVIGSCSPTQLMVTYYYDNEWNDAGGRRRF